MTAAPPDSRAEPHRRPVPWTLDDATRLLALNVVGLAVLTVGWVEVSGTARLSRQYAWASVAVVGLLFALVGNGLWVLNGRRAVGERTRVILASRTPREDSDEQPSAPRRTVEARPDSLVATSLMSRYHRPSCVLVREKAVKPQGRDVHERAGRRGCEVCQP